MNVSGVLKKWYQHHKRDLPWRNTKDPYIIWLSEIILQQTRVDQGLPYFEKFALAFPTIKNFAEAKEDKILKLWQGLGYYTRARNMHQAAKQIVKSQDGKFPQKIDALKNLKGIGDYTAAAILSFAFNKAYAVVDGNVHRFLSRYFGIKEPLSSSMGKKKFYALADDLLDKKNPGLHNQAIMEFGALQCKPLNPDCNICPLNKDCFAFVKNKVRHLPVKSKPPKIKERFFHYLFLKRGTKIYIRKRTADDIWKNLYELPLIETERKTGVVKIIKSAAWKKIFGNINTHIQSLSPAYRHKLSHQTIHARFYEIELKVNPLKQNGRNFIEIELNDLKKYGISRLTELYLQQKNFNVNYEH